MDAVFKKLQLTENGLAIVRDKIGLKVQFCTDGANAVSVFVNLRKKTNAEPHLACRKYKS